MSIQLVGSDGIGWLLVGVSHGRPKHRIYTSTCERMGFYPKKRTGLNITNSQEQLGSLRHMHYACSCRARVFTQDSGYSLQQSLLHRHSDGRCTGIDSQFVVNTGQMGFDRSFRDAEIVCNLFIALPTRHRL